MNGPALVVLSPHLDDAALSCGGRIVHAVDGGRRVVVATFFTEDEPFEPPSQLAADLRRWWKLPPGEVMKHRRAEDLEACRRLGAEAVHLDLPEAPYRRDERGAILYRDVPSLYAELHPADEPWRERLAARIETLLAGLPADAEVLGPLGVGGHVDHVLVRAALERVRPPRDPATALYEEFPYNEWKLFAVRRALGGLRDQAGWVAESLPLDAALLERRAHAIEAFVSQVPAMFRTGGRLRKQLRRAAKKSGGERIWRRR